MRIIAGDDTIYNIGDVQPYTAVLTIPPESAYSNFTVSKLPYETEQVFMYDGVCVLCLVRRACDDVGLHYADVSDTHMSASITCVSK